MVAKYTKWIDGDILYAADLNDGFALSRTTEIINGLNAESGSLVHPNMVLQAGGAGSTSSSGWLGNGSSYYLYNGSVSIIDFGSLLVDYQKQNLSAGSTAVFYADDDKLRNDVEVADGIIDNYSFEGTFTGSSMGSWTIGSVNTNGNINCYVGSTYVFDQSYSFGARRNGVTPSDYGQGQFYISQSIDVTNVKSIGLIGYGHITTASNPLYTYSYIKVGDLTTGYKLIVSGNTGTVGSKVNVLDVSSLTGTQTLTIAGSLDANNSGTTDSEIYIDCVFVEKYTTGSVTKTYSISPNGSSGWTTGSQSQIIDVGSIYDIGFRLSYTNDSVLLGSPVVGSIVQSSFGDFGINFG